MKIEQLAPNQIVVTDEEKGEKFFQSYDSRIVKIDFNGKVTLGRDWKYSATTSRHRSKFLGETTAVTQAKLDSGEYAYDEKL